MIQQDNNFNVDDFKKQAGYDLASPTPDQVIADVDKYGYERLSQINFKRAEEVYHVIDQFYSVRIEESECISFQEAETHCQKSKSPGFPHNQEGYPTKEEALKNNGDLIRQTVEMMTRIIIMLAWFVSPKEEIRPIEKLKLGKIRSFMTGPIELQILGEALFHNFSNKLSQAFDIFPDFPHVAGFSKFRRGWHGLTMWQNFFKYSYCSDVSQSDSSLIAYLLEKICQLRFNRIKKGPFTEEQFKYMKINYVMNLIWGLVISVFGDVIMKTLGIPSGGFTTYQDNMMSIFFVTVYGWAEQDKEKWAESPANSFYRFLTYCRYKGGGDDTRMPLYIQPNNVPIINIELMAGTFLNWGIVNNYEKLTLTIDTEFLSTKSKWIEKYQLFAPLMNHNKLKSSLLLASRRPDKIRWSFARACALRMESWPDDELTILLNKFIKWCLYDTLNRQRMESESDMDEFFTYTALLSMYKSDAELDRLYYNLDGPTVVGNFYDFLEQENF